jgi:hypothetical protein
MKHIKNLFSFWAAVLLGAAVVSCEETIIYPSYDFVLPELPPLWGDLLGAPSWQIEWTRSDGSTASADLAPGSASLGGADIMQEWPTPVIAYPYWPEKGVAMGTMKPSGAIFPLDASGGTMRLSWQGGVEAFFYRELAAEHIEGRLPHTFDWNRFRALWTEGALPEEVLADPWVADWKSIAQKTAASGFDKRRISAQKKELLRFVIPVDGPWIGVSPFMSAPNWPRGSTVYLPAGAETETYFCPSGILHYNKKVWTWREF